MRGSYRRTDQGELFGGAAAMAATLGRRGYAAVEGLEEAKERLRGVWAGFALQYRELTVEVAFWAGRARPDFRSFSDAESFADFTAQVERAGFQVAWRCV